MALGDRIRQTSESSFSVVATATVATLATLDIKNREEEGSFAPSVATVAEVAVAGSGKKVSPPQTSGIKLPTSGLNPWDWLRPISDRQPCYSGRDQGPSCFSCKSYDGKGGAWPGVCRYPENIGRVALEIDWNVVDPAHGCGSWTKPLPRQTRLWPQLRS